MPDDFILNPGVGGDSAAGDEIGPRKFQRIKLIKGADGINDGDIDDANPWPVKLIDVNGTALAGGPGAAANALRVELPTDGQGRIFARAQPVANSPGGITTVPFTGISTEIVPANATRKAVLLYNEGAFDVRIGVGEGATPDRVPLLPGAYLVFEGVGAINGWVPIAAGADVDVTWADESY